MRRSKAGKKSLALGLLCLLLLGAPAARAQDAPDTLRALTLPDLYRRLTAWHPVVRQADLLPRAARAELLQARGQFDPKIQSDLARKEFKDKEYYNRWDSNLKVPLWPGGLDLKAGYERNTGAYLNPEATVPATGLTYAGLSLPLASAIGMDERRATLRQAQLFQEINEAERVKTINKAVFTAFKAYWDWFEAARRREFLATATRLAAERYDATSLRVVAGDLAAIDTLEAGLLVRERRVAEQQAYLDAYQTALALSVHLWDADGRPVVLDPRATPPALPVAPAQRAAITETELNERLLFVTERHPEVRKLILKNQQLRIEERWRRTDLLPDLTLNYNLLSSGHPGEGDFAGQSFQNSYKLGASLSVPLLFRKERGKLESVRVKQIYNDLDLLALRRDLTTSVRAAAAEQRTLAQLLAQQRRMTEQYAQLRQGEVDKFEAGESTVFLVNSRDSKLLEAELKLVQLEAKLQKAQAGLTAAIGALDWEP
jgi:outer membrane protein